MTTQPAAPFADIETMLSTECMAMFANVIATPAAGAPFAAQLDALDRLAYDAAIVGDYRLRYLAAAATLAEGDELTLDGPLAGGYRVATSPEHLNAHDATVQLVRLTAGQGG